MKGYKTIIFGVAVGLLGALSTPEMQAFINDNLPGVSAGLGTIIIILRAVTSSPIFKKN